MNSNTFNYPFVRSFLKQLLTEEKYKRITPPEYLKNKYYIDNKYAFYLGIDAIVKYEQIINDEDLIEEYISGLTRIFKKIDNYSDIMNAIYTLIIKIIASKLSLSNTMSFSSRQKILYYAYNKYIVNGYFYFGFSSNYLNEIECVGIRSNTFFIDDKLKYINDIFEKSTQKLLFLNQKTTITDDIMIATYFSFVSPYYLADMVVNPLFNSNKIDRECFYNHDIIKIKDSLIQVCDNLKIDFETKKEVVNNFIDCYNLSCTRGIKPCVAKISRASINKNKLKDIDEIINNTDEDLVSAFESILESRYTIFNITDTISPYDIEVVKLPTFIELLDSNQTINLEKKITINSEELKIDNSLKKRINSNCYGIISVAFIGLLFIVVGSFLAVILSFIGG